MTLKETLSIPFDALDPLGDASGNVLTGTVSGRGGLSYGIHAPDGRLLGTADLGPPNFGLTVPLASGFAGVSFLSGVPGTLPALVRVTSDGRITEIDPSGGVAAADPRGGLVHLGGDVLTSYDDQMNPRWRLSLQLPGVRELAVDVDGNVLLLFGATARIYDLNGLWVDAAGRAEMPFAIERQVFIDLDTFRLMADVQGGLFLWHQTCPEAGGPCSSRWQGRYAALSTVSEAVPPWLSARPSSALVLIRSDTAYAVAGTSVPACALELVNADGVTCGIVDFSGAFATSGALRAQLPASTGAPPPCHSRLGIGRDGTVVSLTSRGTGLECPGTTCPVSYDWFPEYFR